MRWKAFIPVIIIIAHVCGFVIFFMDGMIKSTIIKNGQSIFKAKVEVAEVKTSLKDFSINIKGLAIADAENPWTNFIEVKEIRAQFTPTQLLYKKLIVEEMSAEGISFGGARETSGVLKKEKKVEKKKKEKKKKEKEGPGIIDKMVASIELPDTEEIEKKLKGLVDPKNLESYKKVEAVKADFNQTSENWKKAADEINPDDIKKAVEPMKDLSALKVKTVADIPKAKKKITELKNAKKKLEAYKDDIKAKKDMVAKDLAGYKGLMKEIDKLKDTDLKNKLSELNLNVDVKEISKNIFGPVVLEKAAKVRNLHKMVKKYMPARKKKAKKVEKKRAKGIDVTYPLENVYPGFLVKKVHVSGIKNNVNFKGEVRGVTSDPALYGKPVKLDIGGKDAAGASVSLKGTLDHTTETMRDQFNILVDGIDLKSRNVKAGVAKVFTGILFTNNYWGVNFNFRAQGLKLAPLEPANDKKNKLINEVISQIDVVEVKGNVSERDGKMEYKLSSNLDKLIAEKLKDVLGKKVDEAKAKLRKEIDKAVNAKKAELQDLIKSKENFIKDQLGGKEKLVDEKINELKSKIDQGQGDIKNQGQKKVDEEKKKLQKKGVEELKKLFKF